MYVPNISAVFICILHQIFRFRISSVYSLMGRLEPCGAHRQARCMDSRACAHETEGRGWSPHVGGWGEWSKRRGRSLHACGNGACESKRAGRAVPDQSKRGRTRSSVGYSPNRACSSAQLNKKPRVQMEKLVSHFPHLAI